MKTFFAVIFILGLFLFGTAQAVNYSYTYLDIPGKAVDMNDRGEIVGWYNHDINDRPPIASGFLYRNNYWTEITFEGDFGDIYTITRPYAINNQGIIAGTLDTSVLFGFMYDGLTYTVLAPPGTMETLLYDINDYSKMVGISCAGDNCNYRGYLLVGTTYTWLRPPWSAEEPANEEVFWPSQINNQDVIIGEIPYGPNKNWYSVHDGLWTRLLYPGSISTKAWNLNNLGIIVGQYTDSAGKIHAFRYNRGYWTSNTYPGSTETIAFDVNDKSVIAGTYVDADGKHHGFSFANGAWSRLDYPGATETTTYLINNNGWIVGSFTKDGQEGQFLAKPITNVKIDIKPWNCQNNLNPRDTGTISVAILGSYSFRPFNVLDTNTLTFGHTGDEASLSSCSTTRQDVNYDGYADMICRFSIPKTGFHCGDTSGTLKGKNLDGNPIEGKSYVRIVGCN